MLRRRPPAVRKLVITGFQQRENSNSSDSVEGQAHQPAASRTKTRNKMLFNPT